MAFGNARNPEHFCLSAISVVFYIHDVLVYARH
jgi:hypothetical protein